MLLLATLFQGADDARQGKERCHIYFHAMDSVANAKVRKEESDDADRLEWIQANEHLFPRNSEGIRENLIRKTKENPFVPIGILATTVALTYGLVSMKMGNKSTSQLMMRARVVAQGFTVVAIVVGLGMATSKQRDQR